MNGTNPRPILITVMVLFIQFFGWLIFSESSLGYWFYNGLGTPEKARRVNCTGNLKQIGRVLLQQLDESGSYPDLNRSNPNDFSSLGVAEKVLQCPSHKRVASEPSYVYVGQGISPDHPDAIHIPIVVEYRSNHDGEWQNILYADGHLEGRKL